MAYVYGSKVNSKWRAFISYTVVTNNDTTYSISVSAGLDADGSGYKSSNASCTLSGTGQTTYSVSGKTASGTNHVMVGAYTYTWAKGTSAASKTVTAVTKTSGGTVAPGTSTATYTFNVPAKASYTVSYNANGGSGAPASQTKYYNDTLTLSATVPTKTGYTFSGWKSTAGTIYQPGGSYTANAATTMTAQWTADTVPITYNANGGVGAIAAQTKAYDQTLTLSDGSGFTKQNHSITGWNTAADGTGTAYSLSQVLSSSFLTALNLYAQWHLDYIAPIISNFTAYRVASSSSTTETDDGTYIYIAFDYTAGTADSGSTWEVPRLTIEIDGTAVVSSSALPYDASGQGTYGHAFGTYAAENTHTVEVTLNDSYGVDTTVTVLISTATFPIDLIGNGLDVYMGIMTPAENGQVLKLAGGTKVGGALTATGNLSVGGNTSTVNLTATGNATISGTTDTLDVYIELPNYTTASTTDKAIYDDIVALGWDSDVLS